MVDSYTPNLNLIQPLVGGDSGTWGGLLNAGVMGVLDNILGGNYSTSITSADVTLTTTQFQNGIFILTGALTGPHNLILPFQTNSTTAAVGGKFIVVNNTSGAYPVSVKTAAANATSGVALAPQGQAVALYSDQINVAYDNTGLPASVRAVSGNPTNQLAGTAGATNVNASLAADYAAGQLYLCTVTGTAATAQWANVAGYSGFDTARNLSFTTSVSANVLTITALAANTGTTPASGTPITIPFRDATAGTTANGDPVLIQVTSTLSISTVLGATFGVATANAPFRLWIVGFNNAGSAVLALTNCLTSTQVAPLNEATLQSSLSMNSGTAAGTFYTPSGTTVTAKAWRILGYIDYSSGLATPGTFNNTPNVTQLFGPGINKPGEILQIVAPVATSATTTLGTGTTQTQVTLSIVPSASPNPVQVFSNVFVNTGATDARLQLSRGTSVPVGNIGVVGQNIAGNAPLAAFDLPGTTVAQNYYVYGFGGTASQAVVNGGNVGASSLIWAYEFMG